MLGFIQPVNRYTKIRKPWQLFCSHPWLVLIQYTHGVDLHIISPAQKKKLDMTCSKQLITDNIPWLRMTPYSSPCEPVSLPADALIELVQTSLARWNHIYCWFIHPKLDSLNLPRIRLIHLVEHAKSYSTIVGKFSWYFYPKTWTFSHAQPPATSKGGN